MSDQDPEVCRTCDNSRAWHEANNPIHPFNDGQAGATAFLDVGRGRDGQRRRVDRHGPSQTPSQVVWPNDPVLRVALINKGILTADDLRDAETQLRAVMGMGGSLIQSPDKQYRAP